MREDEFDQQIDAIGTLQEPTRRAIYRHVINQLNDVSRDEAAEAAGISRMLAAFHLDRLVEAGLLDAVYRRLSGRTGPGAGRSSKLYRRSSRQFGVSLPEQRYELLAGLFARALNGTPDDHAPEALVATAREAGTRLGQEAAQPNGGMHATTRPVARAIETLADYGFEPLVEGEWIRLRNCPFQALAIEYPNLVCDTNFSLMSGFSHGLGTGVLRPERELAEGRCCVRLHVAMEQLPERM